MAIDTAINSIPYVGPLFAAAMFVYQNPVLLTIVLANVLALVVLILARRSKPEPKPDEPEPEPKPEPKPEDKKAPLCDKKALPRHQRDVCLRWWKETFADLAAPVDWTNDHVKNAMVNAMGDAGTQVRRAEAFWRTRVAPLPDAPAMPEARTLDKIVTAFRDWVEDVNGFDRRVAKPAAPAVQPVAPPALTPEQTFVKYLAETFKLGYGENKNTISWLLSGLPLKSASESCISVMRANVSKSVGLDALLSDGRSVAKMSAREIRDVIQTMLNKNEAFLKEHNLPLAREA